MVLIDSSAWIASLRRDGPLPVKMAVQALLEEYEAAWCSAVRLEVMGGARKEERAALDDYFSVIPYRQVTEKHWTQATALARHLRDRGVTVPWMDTLIATVAIQEKLRLYALDAHFSHIAEHTALHLYTPGYGGSYSAS